MKNSIIACLAVILAGEWGWLPHYGMFDMTADPVSFLIGLFVIAAGVITFTITWLIVGSNLTGEAGE